MTTPGDPKVPQERAPRILYVLGSLDPLTGGPANSAPHMWMSAVRTGLPVTAAFVGTGAAVGGEQAMIQRLADSGIELHRFAAPVRPAQCARWGVSWAIAAWLISSARRFDVVHAHGAWMFSSLVALVAAKVSGAAFVLTPHESLTAGDVAKGPARLKHAVKQLVKMLLLRCSDAVIFASQVERKESGGHSSCRHTEVFYHPVVDERVAPALPRAFAPETTALRLSYLGRFDPKKNIELLFEVVEKLPRTSLQMGGRGSEPYERHLRTLAYRLKIDERVHWRGFVSVGDRANFFSACDVLVMPSAFEGFGMVAGEALSHGTPAIVSDTAGIGELVSRYDCGLVVPATVAAIVEAIERMSANRQDLERFSRNALKMCADELTFAAYGVKLADTYRSIMMRRRQG